MKRISPPALSPEDVARFWGRVRKSDGCWLWIMERSASGYGQFQVNGRPYAAHRVSYAIANGPVLDGLIVCHSCHNKACVRPDHLHAGTPADNGADNIGRYGDIRAGYLSLGEAGRVLGVSRLALRREVAGKRLAGQVHAEWFIAEAEVERYRREVLGKPGWKAKVR